MATTLFALTDVHAGSEAVGHGASRKLTGLAPSLLKETLLEVPRRPEIQGVLDLGDLIEHSSKVASPQERIAIDRANFAKVLGEFDTLNVPSLHCIGNHPLMALTEEMISSVTGLAQPYYARDIGEHRVIMLHSRFTYKADVLGHKSGSGIFIDADQLD